MSISSIKSTAEWVRNLAVQEVQYLGKVRDNVEDLKSELEWMQCFLLDADGKQNNDALIRRWMSEISDLALEAEEIIEVYILKVSRKREPQNGILDDLIWLTCFWKDAITLHKVGSQIDGLTSKISKLTSRLQTYGVRGSYDFQSSHKAMVRKLLAEERRTYSHDEANYVVGIQEQVDRLITQLQAPQKIVVVHGMGGIGKTTLARQIFGHRRSKDCFTSVAWAYVSQQVHLETICRDIMYQLIPDERKKTKELSDSELPGKLCTLLLQKKYLVVLDDVWTVGNWNRIAPAFPIQDPSCRSKLLITTRNPQLLSHLGDGVVSTWEAKTLDDHNDWELLQNKGNFVEKSLPDPAMKLVARKMLEHCNGNPLAIVALGGVLATKKTLQEWESVFDNLQSHLQGDGSYSRVYDVLAMGYYDLHYNMKPCFLHMGHFPEDFRVGVERIYNLWIAEGIVSQTQDRIGSKRSLEDIANNYMNQLVQKGMIEVEDIDAFGNINTCNIHDLMRDKCLEIINEENYIQIVDLEKEQAAANNVHARSGRVRRLTMHVGNETCGESVLKASSGSVSSLRSLLFVSTCSEEDRNEVPCEWIKDICESFELLRVLDFEGVVLKQSLPSEVGNLIYLRYLSLRETHITELPSSISNLRSLLILDLRVKKVRIKLPNVLWNMASLRLLYFPTRLLSQEEYDVRCQGYEIEDGNSKLILDNLTHLERVDNVDLDRVDENGLQILTSVRKLSATCKESWNGLVSILKSKSIKQLSLKVAAGLLHGESSMVLSDSESLKILHIDAEREPNTFLPIRAEMFPCNLVELGFWYIIIEEDPMPILEQLRNLRILQFRTCYDGEKMKCSSTGFPEVTYLALDGLWYLKDWSIDKGGFPKLQEIGIYNCPLRKFPRVLSPNISISCTDELQEKVNEFRAKVKVSEGEPGSSTGRRSLVACSTWE